MPAYAFGNARARLRGANRHCQGGDRRGEGGKGNENGCGSSLACKMLRRRYHTARD